MPDTTIRLRVPAKFKARVQKLADEEGLPLEDFVLIKLAKGLQSTPEETLQRLTKRRPVKVSIRQRKPKA